jgi:hypothetical protein
MDKKYTHRRKETEGKRRSVKFEDWKFKCPLAETYLWTWNSRKLERSDDMYKPARAFTASRKDSTGSIRLFDIAR